MARRLEQVSALIARNLSAIIRRDLELPPGVIVGVVKVSVDADLKFARILISVLPEDQGEAITAFLNNRKKFLRQELAKGFTARITPSLNFALDSTAAQASRIDQLIDSLNLPGAAG